MFCIYLTTVYIGLLFTRSTGECLSRMTMANDSASGHVSAQEAVHKLTRNNICSQIIASRAFILTLYVVHHIHIKRSERNGIERR